MKKEMYDAYKQTTVTKTIDVTAKRFRLYTQTVTPDDSNLKIQL